MKTIHFLCVWNKNKRTTWSGTPYALITALSAKANVIDHDISLPRLLKIWYSILRRLKFGYKNLFLEEVKAQRFLNSHIRGNVIQFAEVLEDNDSRKTYFYTDGSADYLLHLYDSDRKLYDFVGLPRVIIRENLVKRRDFQKKYFDKCSGIFVMGEWLAKDLIERTGINPNKVHPVGGGINIDYTKREIKKKAGNKILFIGRDWKRKGLPILIEAFKILLHKMPNAELHICGPKKEEINDDTPNCFYYGNSSSDTIIKLLNECDIFVMPSYFEPYGLVFIEALTFGLPCIGRNCFEMPYFIENGKTGYLIDADDAHDLASKIKDLLKNEAIHREVTSRFNDYKTRYSWEAVADRMLNVISH